MAVFINLMLATFPIAPISPGIPIFPKQKSSKAKVPIKKRLYHFKMPAPFPCFLGGHIKTGGLHKSDARHLPDSPDIPGNPDIPETKVIED